MEDRVIKLLEVATHPTTGDGERSNAISMIRRLADKKGGIAQLVGASSSHAATNFDDFDRMIEATRRAHRLERERDAAIVRLTKLQARLRTLAGDNDLDDPVVALYGALNGEWQTLGQIVTVARRNGFTGAENTLRKRADNLAMAGTIEVQAREPRSWRLKP